MDISTLIILSATLIVAFYTDVRYKKIPNLLTVFAAAAGLTNQVALYGLLGGGNSLVAAVAGFFALSFLYAFKAVGAGDVKLFAAIGAISGVEFVLYAIMYSVVYGGMIGLVILLSRRKYLRKFWELIRNVIYSVVLKSGKLLNPWRTEGPIQIPFMYAVVPGAFTAWIYL